MVSTTASTSPFAEQQQPQPQQQQQNVGSVHSGSVQPVAQQQQQQQSSYPGQSQQATYTAVPLQQQQQQHQQNYTTGSTAVVASEVSGGLPAASVTSTVAQHVIDEEQMQREYTGEGRLISVTSRVDESRSHVLEEEYVEHEIRVPRRIVREEVIEKVIVVPEKRQTEEIVEDLCKVRERIIKIARPTIIEKIVEIPEIEYIEKIVEVPERIVQEKIVEVEKIIREERIVDVPRIEYVERSYEVIDDSLPVQYRDYQVDKIVEVEDWKDEIVVREVVVPQYVEKSQPIYVEKEVVKNIPVDVPLPVEAEITYEFTLPHLQPNFHKVTYPVYLPRFIEVPVAAELLTPQLNYLAENFRTQIKALENGASTGGVAAPGTGPNTVTPVSLQEIEELATQIMKTDFQTQLSSVDLQSAVMNAWHKGTLPVRTDLAAETESQHMMNLTRSAIPTSTTTTTSRIIQQTKPIPSPRLINPTGTVTTTTTVYHPQSSQAAAPPSPAQPPADRRHSQQNRQSSKQKSKSEHNTGSRKASFNPLYPLAQSTGNARIVKPVNSQTMTRTTTTEAPFRTNVVY